MCPSLNPVPSLQQWHKLVNARAGLFDKSPFEESAERLMGFCDNGAERLVNLHLKLEKDVLSYGLRSDRQSTGQKALAEALLAVIKFSHRSIQQVTLIGGADAGLVAAIALWLLDVNIEIVTQPDGVVAFKNHAQGDSVQLRVIYGLNEHEASPRKVQVVGEVYRLHSGQGLLRHDYRRRHEIVSGRVPWSKALSATFG